jgi:hypothetical protein
MKLFVSPGRALISGRELAKPPRFELTALVFGIFFTAFATRSACA